MNANSQNNISRRKSKIRYLIKSIDLIGTQIYDYGNDEERQFRALVQCLQKPKRNLNDNCIIFNQIKSYKFAQTYEEQFSNNLEILAELSMNLKYLFIPSNRLLFRFGDHLDLFYLILDGKVSIVIPTEKKVEMNLKEYVTYLRKLKYHKEEELIYKCFHHNKNTFGLSEKELESLIKLKEITQKNQFETFKHSTKMVIRKSLTTDLIHNNELDITSVEEYINRYKPEIDVKRVFDKKLVLIYEYKKVGVIEKGGKFGDYAFSSMSKKRMSSILTESDCHFATLSTRFYDEILSEANSNIKTTNLNWILKNSIFEDIDKVTFERKYYNYFINCKIKSYHTICKEGEESNYVYFIKSGTFEIHKKLTIDQITELIGFYEGKNLNNVRELKNQNSQNKILDKKLSDFSNHIRFLKIAIVCGKDIFGLDDSSFQGKYLYTIRSISESEYFRIEKNLLNKIIESEIFCRKKIIKQVKLKNEMFSERLSTIKKTLLAKYEKENKLENLMMESNKFLTENNTNLPTKYIIKKQKQLRAKFLESNGNDRINTEKLNLNPSKHSISQIEGDSSKVNINTNTDYKKNNKTEHTKIYHKGSNSSLTERRYNYTNNSEDFKPKLRLEKFIKSQDFEVLNSHRVPNFSTLENNSTHQNFTGKKGTLSVNTSKEFYPMKMMRIRMNKAKSPSFQHIMNEIPNKTMKKFIFLNSRLKSLSHSKKKIDI